MRYTIYTDGAAIADNNIAGCAYVILTDSTYIISKAKAITGLSNPTYAETIAVGLAASKLLSEIKPTALDIVEFNIDCKSTIQFYNEYINDATKQSKYIKTNNQDVVNAVRSVQELAKVCTVRLMKVRGHKNKLNPNTYVDRLCKIAIRKV